MKPVVLLRSVSGAISEAAARGPPVSPAESFLRKKTNNRVADKLEPYP